MTRAHFRISLGQSKIRGRALDIAAGRLEEPLNGPVPGDQTRRQQDTYGSNHNDRGGRFSSTRVIDQKLFDSVHFSFSSVLYFFVDLLTPEPEHLEPDCCRPHLLGITGPGLHRKGFPFLYFKLSTSLCSQSLQKSILRAGGQGEIGSRTRHIGTGRTEEPLKGPVPGDQPRCEQETNAGNQNDRGGRFGSTGVIGKKSFDAVHVLAPLILFFGVPITAA
jgi:hypothetical protein